MCPDLHLQALFDEYNLLYFLERLEPHAVVRVPADSLFLLTPKGVRVPVRGRLDPKNRLVQIAEELDDERARQTLLHEMCHIGTPGHGEDFRSKLSEIAQKGETWATRDIQEILVFDGDLYS